MTGFLSRPVLVRFWLVIPAKAGIQ